MYQNSPWPAKFEKKCHPRFSRVLLFKASIIPFKEEPMPRITFVPISRLAAELDLDIETLTAAEQARLYSTLVAATHQVELISGRFLMPRSLSIPHMLHRPSTTELLLDEDLLELHSVTNGDSSPIPVDSLELVGSGLLYALDGYQFLRDNRGKTQPIVIQGIWGWHDCWSEAWRSSQDTVNTTLSTISTSLIPVTDADASDPVDGSPRFQSGPLLKIDSEFMALQAVDADANTLRVLRGQLGTSITNHEVGSIIQVYNPPPFLESLVVRWAVWLYQLPQHRQRTAVPADLMLEANALRRVSVKS
jgi:hypothetical protein